MLVPYVRPQDTITQILQTTPAREQSRRNPIVIGPQFNLYLNDGRDMSAASLDFSVGGASLLPYQDTSGNDINLLTQKPHTESAELNGKDLEALVAQFATSTIDIDTNEPTWRTLRTVNGDLFIGDGTLHTTLDGRQVRIGDVIDTSWDDNNGGSGVTKRSVVGFKGVLTDAVAAASLVKSAADANGITSAGSTFLIAGPTTAGYAIDSFSVADNQFLRSSGKTFLNGAGDTLLGDELTFTVTTGGDNITAQVTVTSQATGLSVAGVASADGGLANLFDIDLSSAGYGVADTLTLDHTGDLTIGDVIVVRLFPAFTAPAISSLVTVGGDFTGQIDLRYVIEIVNLDIDGLNGTINVYDTAGEEAILTNADPATGGNLGVLGLTYTMADDAGYYVGQRFYVDAVAASVSSTKFDGLTLSGPAVPSHTMATYLNDVFLDSVKVYQKFTGSLDTDNTVVGDAVTAGAETWSYASNLGLSQDETGRDTAGLSLFETGVGKVILSYKAAVIPKQNESMLEITSPSALTAALGETKQANWLARGSLEAFRGNQSQVVYALRTGGDTIEDMAAALEKIRMTDQVYALVPMTDNLEIQQLVKDHCETQSNKYNKNFRRCYVATDSPGSYEYWGQLPGGGYRQAELDSSIVTISDDFADSWEFTANDVGSTVKIFALGLTFEIIEVLSPSEALTDAASGLTTGGTASGFTVTRPDTREATALYVRARSRSLESRRCVNVWCHNPTVSTSYGTEILQNKFVAAEIAGLRCALLPQQGLTLTELLSVGEAPGMYATFTPEIIDDIAADGTMVVSQESEGGDVFIRHQLTTRVESNRALEYEDNVGVIVDEFSFEIKDTFREYIGRRNATPDTIGEIDDALKGIATDYTQEDIVNRDIGPPILAFFDENGVENEVTVRQDGDLADTLLTYVKLRVPLPLNGINHYVDVEVAELIDSEDNGALQDIDEA